MNAKKAKHLFLVILYTDPVDNQSYRFSKTTVFLSMNSLRQADSEERKRTKSNSKYFRQRVPAILPRIRKLNITAIAHCMVRYSSQETPQTSNSATLYLANGPLRVLTFCNFTRTTWRLSNIIVCGSEVACNSIS